MVRSTEAVMMDHLTLAQRGEIDIDIERNFAPDCVLMTSYGTFRGHEGIRAAAALLDEQIGRPGYEYRTASFHGELGFLEWTATSDTMSIDDGADSYWVHDGLIRAMTAHYTLRPR